MKRISIALIGLIFLVVCILLHPSFNGKNPYFNYLHYLVWGNNLNVECIGSINKTKVKIIFENELALLQNSRPIEYNHLQKKNNYHLIREVIFIDGKKVMDIPYDYGKQKLTIFYDGRKLGEMGHWRTNHYHVHNYKIKLVEEVDKIILRGGIFGPDDMGKYINNDTL